MPINIPGRLEHVGRILHNARYLAATCGVRAAVRYVRANLLRRSRITTLFYIEEMYDLTDEAGEPLQDGWYWWAGFLGCLPDSEPCGPFTTEQEALNDARSIK